MIGALVGFWSGLPKWAQDTLKIVGAGFLLALAGKAFMDALREEGAKRQQAKQDVETAKERERVLGTAQKEVDNVEAAKDAALAAPDSLPEFGSADELRNEAPAIAKVILRDRSGHQP